MCQMQHVPFDMREFAQELITIMTSLEGEAYAIIKVSKTRGRGRRGSRRRVWKRFGALGGFAGRCLSM
jgi:hypothetical protein